MISITAAIFACQLVICDITSCGNLVPPNTDWHELIENIEVRLNDCNHAEVRRIDKPYLWFINANAASYGWDDELLKMTVYHHNLNIPSYTIR